MHIHVHFTYALTRCKHLLNAQMHIHQAVNIHTYMCMHICSLLYIHVAVTKIKCSSSNSSIAQTMLDTINGTNLWFVWSSIHSYIRISKFSVNMFMHAWGCALYVYGACLRLSLQKQSFNVCLHFKKVFVVQLTNVAHTPCVLIIRLLIDTKLQTCTIDTSHDVCDTSHFFFDVSACVYQSA